MTVLGLLEQPISGTNTQSNLAAANKLATPVAPTEATEPTEQATAPMPKWYEGPFASLSNGANPVDGSVTAATGAAKSAVNTVTDAVRGLVTKPTNPIKATVRQTVKGIPNADVHSDVTTVRQTVANDVHIPVSDIKDII